MRLFLAVFPPPAVQRIAHAASEALRHEGDGVSWVKPDNLHYTMRFLGELGEEGARRAGAAVAAAATSVARFDAALGRLGAFPDPRHARVLWLGMSEGAERLVEVARALERALRQQGFGPADRAFAPHLTLGRVRQPGTDWTPRIAAVPVEPARFAVERLCLVESTLSPRGSTYRVRAESLLV